MDEIGRCIEVRSCFESIWCHIWCRGWLWMTGDEIVYIMGVGMLLYE